MEEVVFNNLIHLLCLGLREKQEHKRKYKISTKLSLGFSLFTGAANKYYKSVVPKLHEALFIKEYLTKPVSEWFKGWDTSFVEQIKNYSLYNLEALLITHDDHLVLSPACEDICMNAGHDPLNNAEEKLIYLKLAELPDELYTKVRVFLIEHPQTTDEVIEDFKFDCGNEPVPRDSYICPVCGWTMQFYEEQPSCCNISCISSTLKETDLVNQTSRAYGYNLRLRHGIMRYISIPGQEELKIRDIAVKKGCSVEMYPHKDMYDLKITTKTGKVYAVDAKTQRSPYALQEAIVNDRVFTEQEVSKSDGKLAGIFYVIPQERIKDNPKYCKICDVEGHPNCITDKQLFIQMKKDEDELNGGKKKGNQNKS